MFKFLISNMSHGTKLHTLIINAQILTYEGDGDYITNEITHALLKVEIIQLNIMQFVFALINILNVYIHIQHFHS